MRFEVLKPNKIKVTLDSEDLIKWGVSADAVAKNSPEAREMFLELLKQAEQETGFECSNSRLVVEAAVNENEGHLTLFVTKVANEEERQIFDKISAVCGSDLIKKARQKKAATEKYGAPILELDSLEDVILLCHELSGYSGGSLYSYSDKYYMTLDEVLIPRASEFGRVRSARKRIFTQEHATCVIAENAFETVRENFNI